MFFDSDRLVAAKSGRGKRLGSTLLALCLTQLLLYSPLAKALEPSEYRLKAAFLYNFALFTEWPAEVGRMLTLCIVGPDSFGQEIDELQGKAVGERSLLVQRRDGSESFKGCQMVFIPAQAMGSLARVLDELRNRPVLTVADSPGATRQGVALNMAVTNSKVTFEANLQAARAAHLNLSSKMLRVATEVLQ